MSAIGSGHAISRNECPLLGVKRTWNCDVSDAAIAIALRHRAARACRAAWPKSRRVRFLIRAAPLKLACNDFAVSAGVDHRNFRIFQRIVLRFVD
jgi:hypothetical protein